MSILSPEVQLILDTAKKEKALKEQETLLEAQKADLKKAWDALPKSTNPSVKQLQARVEVIEEQLGLSKG